MPLSLASNNESTTFAYPFLASFFIVSAYHILYKGVFYTPSSPTRRQIPILLHLK